MRRRQTEPERWLIINRPLSPDYWKMVQRLPRGSGILVLHPLTGAEQRRLRRVARTGRHSLASEARGRTARVHSARELTRALILRPDRVLLSPMHETLTHPQWKPMPRMRAAALARCCGRNAVALGGMTARRYRRLAVLGFVGWAAITAFRT